MELYNLAEHYNYGDLTFKMIRDRLVIGIQDASLLQWLQLDSKLTLKKAKKLVQQCEVIGTGVAATWSNVEWPGQTAPNYDIRRPWQHNSKFKQRQFNSKPYLHCVKGQHPRRNVPLGMQSAIPARKQKIGYYGACYLMKIDKVSSDHCYAMWQ